MDNFSLIFGLLDISRTIASREVAAKLRSFTISWSRYGYHGLMLEDDNVNAILDKALDLGYSHCLIQAYGHVICENWCPPQWNRKNFHQAVGAMAAQGDFLAAGYLVDEQDGWHGLSDRCLLVNLHVYDKLGRPDYHRPASESERLPKPLKTGDSIDGISLRPSGCEEDVLPRANGWRFIAESLKAGLSIRGFGEAVCSNTLSLHTEDGPKARAFGSYLSGERLLEPRKAGVPLLEDDQVAFLDGIARQLNNVKRGVFLWNVESYGDIQSRPPGFTPPISTLYSVASGLKPNMILHRLGFDEDTRVVFFDYSRNALRIRRLMLQEWDGEDYPRFLQHLFKKFPAPETFYHLWAGLSPDQLDSRDIEVCWQTEIERWGGEHVLKQHWEDYRQLRHEYVECDVLTEPGKLFARIDQRPDSVIWWSNAFFTVYSNWLHTNQERRRLYENWIRGLATENPDLFLYGADCSNTSVNCIQAGPYLAGYREAGDSDLRPSRFHRYEIAF